MTLRSPHWQFRSHEDLVARSSQTLVEQQHRDGLEFALPEQQQVPATAETPELAQQHVGIDRTGNNKMAAFKMNTAINRVVERACNIPESYASPKTIAREFIFLAGILNANQSQLRFDTGPNRIPNSLGHSMMVKAARAT